MPKPRSSYPSKPSLAAVLLATLCTWAPLALALDCPVMPQQSQRDWDVAVAVAVGHVGAASGPQLQAQTRSATTDLLRRLPGADRVYLEQMMYATYCTSLRDNNALSEADRNARIQAYNREVRATLATAAKPATAVDPRDAARAELARIPMSYTPQAFVESARDGKAGVLRLFLQAGMDPNATDDQGATALMHAAGRGDLPMMATLLKAGAGLAGPRANNALGWAASGGRLDAMRILLKAGATQESRDRALLDTLRSSQAAAARFLLDVGANPLADPAETGRWFTMSSAREPEKLAELLDLLLQRGWPVDAASQDGRTALIHAAYDGNDTLIGLLLQAGADPNWRCACNGIFGGFFTPLALSAVSSKDGEAAMQLLLDAGARVEDASNDGTPLLLAASRGHLERVRLLLSRGADPRTADRDGVTVLMYAAGGSVEMVALLLKAGADVNASTRGGNTALKHAAKLDQTRAAEMLLDASANIDHAAPTGRTALMIAAKNGSFDTVRLLLRRGARTDLVDEDKRSALDLAESALKGDDLARMRSLLGRKESK